MVSPHPGPGLASRASPRAAGRAPEVVVKICGVRDPEGAAAVEASGADFAGLLFVPGRRRALDLGRARAVRARLERARPVGVFLDAPPEVVEETAAELGLTWIQLHGREPPGYARRLTQVGLRIVRALSLSGAPPSRAALAAHEPYVEVFLVDGENPGSGTLVDDEALGVDPATLTARPVWLAGGLTPDNVQARLRRTGARGVDVASGVERDGALDPARVHAFVARAKGHRP